MIHVTKQRKNWFLFLCTLLICILAVGLHFSIAPSSDTPASPAYVLSVYGGQVAVFCGDSDTPQEVFETRITSLPREEAERLYHGIPAQDEAALQILIEEYCS